MKNPSKTASSKKTSASASPSENKFIPNLSQLNSATKELPDPDIWPDKIFHCPIEADGKQRILSFVLRTIKRGKKSTSRWVYEGKILIRNRDISRSLTQSE